MLVDLWPLVAHLPAVCDTVPYQQAVVDVSSVLTTRLRAAHAAPSHQADVGVSSVLYAAHAVALTTRLRAARAVPYPQAGVGVRSALTTRLHGAHVLVSRLYVAHVVVLAIHFYAAHVVLCPQVGIGVPSPQFGVGVPSALTTRPHGAHAALRVQEVQCRRRCDALQVPLAVLQPYCSETSRRCCRLVTTSSPRPRVWCLQIYRDCLSSGTV